MPARRFPPPWSVEEQPACFVARGHNGQALAYVYFEDEPGRRSAAKYSEQSPPQQRFLVRAGASATRTIWRTII